MFLNELLGDTTFRAAGVDERLQRGTVCIYLLWTSNEEQQPIQMTVELKADANRLLARDARGNIW